MRAHGAGGVAALREKDLQRHVRAYAERLGWSVYVCWTSIHSPRGWPDLTLYRARADGTGELVCIELKTERGKVSGPQQAWLYRLGTVPGVRWAGVCRPSDWFAGKLDEVLRCCDGD